LVKCAAFFDKIREIVYNSIRANFPFQMKPPTVFVALRAALSGIVRRAVYVYGEYGMTGFLPDRPFLRWHYRLKTGRKLNLSPPVLFNEKIQWSKLHDRRREWVGLVDKYEVRKFVARTVGGEHLIPCYGVWNSFDEIPFGDLPDKFVLKCTHDCDSVVICKDKNSLDMAKLRKSMNYHLSLNHYWRNREWLYKYVRPRIIAEELISDASGSDLKDYKIFCFNGKPKMICVVSDRFSLYKENFYSVAWEHLPLVLTDRQKFEGLVLDKPGNLEYMLELAEKLSTGIPHVRVDLYSAGTKIYFGELTFNHGAGYDTFTPEYNKLLGDLWDLPKAKTTNYGLKCGGTLSVRPAETKDFDAVVDLFGKDESLQVIDKKDELEVFPKEWLGVYLDDTQFLVAEYEGEVVGTLLAEQVRGPGALIWMIAVKGELRGKGIGRILQIDHERRCKQKQIMSITAYADNDESVLNFYKKSGFASGVTCVEVKKNI